MPGSAKPDTSKAAFSSSNPPIIQTHTTNTTMKLNDEQMSILKHEIARAGREHQHAKVFEELNDEAFQAAEDALSDHHDATLEDLEREQSEELKQAFMAGFWENAHKEEREALKAEVASLRAALESIAATRANGNSEPDVMADALEQCTGKASEALAGSKKPPFFVMQVPTMSAAHITKEDGALLCAAGRVEVLAEISGGFGHIVDFPDADTIEEDFAEFSPAFRHILTELAKAGYTYVRFDADHMPCPSFPSFEW